MAGESEVLNFVFYYPKDSQNQSSFEGFALEATSKRFIAQIYHHVRRPTSTCKLTAVGRSGMSGPPVQLRVAVDSGSARGNATIRSHKIMAWTALDAMSSTRSAIDRCAMRSRSSRRGRIGWYQTVQRAATTLRSGIVTCARRQSAIQPI
jgi:hypothetical protein